MYFEAVLYPVILGLLRGGSIKKLGELSLRGLPFLFIPLIIRIATYNFSHRGVEFFLCYGGILQGVAFMILVVFFLLNWGYNELKIAFTGLCLNILVILVNGGVMPVSEQAMEIAGVNIVPRGTHVYIDDTTVMPFLADIIPFPPPYPFTKVVSIGDILIIVGIFLLVYRLVVYGNRKKQRVSD